MMPSDQTVSAPGTARPVNRLPEPPAVLASLPVVLRVPELAQVHKLRPVAYPRSSRGAGAPGKLAAVVLLAAAVFLLLRWHAWLVSADPRPQPAALPAGEVQTLPPLQPAAGAASPGRRPAPTRTRPARNSPAESSAGTARLAPLVVPLETGGPR